ncbi:hypothetical protein ORJ00_01335 [Rheinheimera baltica]|uniref:hypothetical protein n=1 Tax=Rheinheimera baltica TaxID=67576 RepID=UPI00273DCA22|nr:hypothetical protein [Rheinheimera baltica]MDP5141381.1 hypothetical protein [Rheinheimera baltica]
MSQTKCNVIGSRLYLAGSFSKEIEHALKNNRVTELEFLEDWSDFSCFDGLVNEIEYIKLCGASESGKISAVDNIGVFIKLKKLVMLSKVKKDFDLSVLHNLEMIDAIWQAKLSTALKCNNLNKLIIHSVGSDFVNYFGQCSHVEYLWLSKPKIDDLSCLKYFPGLTTLRITDAHKIETVDGIAYCKSLRKLDVENAKLLHDIGEVIQLQNLSNLRLIKLSENLDISIVKSCSAIETLYVGGPNAPVLNWTVLLKNLPLKKVIGWWNPLDAPKDELLSALGSGKTPSRFDVVGGKGRQLLTIEFS